MSAAHLAPLAAEYRSRYSWGRSFDPADQLRKAAKLVADQRSAELADALVLAVTLESVFAAETLNVGDLPGDVVEAFKTAYPNVDLDALDGSSTEALTGYMNAWQGKLFEVTVRDQLNAGEIVGDLDLAPGQTAALAASATQPGWDLAIFDPDGSVVQTVQLKATESAAYVREALERYPDIPVIATSDVATPLAHEQLVSTAAESTTDLTSALPDHASDALDASDFVMPASVVVATEIIAVMTGQKSAESAIESGVTRAAVGTAAAAVGGVVAFVAGGWVGAAAAFGIRLLLGRSLREHNRAQTQPISTPACVSLSKTELAGSASKPRATTIEYKDLPSLGVQAPKATRRAGSNPPTDADLRRIVRYLLSRYCLGLPSPAHRTTQTPNASGGLEDKPSVSLTAAPNSATPNAETDLWVGIMKGTGAELVFDPDLQRQGDRQVWVYVVGRRCMRAFDREDLRRQVRRASADCFKFCAQYYAAWKAENEAAFRRYARQFDLGLGLRNAFAA